MNLIELLLDADLLGYFDPVAAFVVVMLVEAIKRSDRSATKPPKGDRRRRSDDRGRLRAWYPWLPFAVSGVWFGTLAAVGRFDGGEALVLDIGGHGALASSGYAGAKRLVERFVGGRR